MSSKAPSPFEENAAIGSRDYWSAALFLALLLIYALNLYPALTPRDGMEIAAYAPRFIPLHQPGYPLYVLLAGAFSRLLPFGNPGYALNLFSALCCAAGAALLFHASVKILAKDGETRNSGAISPQTASALAVVIIGLSHTVYSQAIQAEVFGLNYLLFAGVWLSAVEFTLKSSIPALAATAFLMGVGLAHHQTIVLCFPAFAFLIYSNTRQTPVSRADQFRAALFFLAGFSTYALIVPLYGGSPLDPSSWQRALSDFLRKNFGTLALAREGAFERTSGSPLASYFGWLMRMGASAWTDFTPIGIAALLLGTISRFRKNAYFVASLMIVIICGPGFLWLTRDMATTPENAATLWRFMPLAYAGAAPILASGFILLGRIIPESWATTRRLIPISLLLALLPFLSGNIREHGRRDCFVIEDYAENIWKSAGRASLVVLESGSAKLAYQYAKMRAPSREAVAVQALDFDSISLPASKYRWDSLSGKFSSTTGTRVESSLLLAHGPPAGSRTSYYGLLVDLSAATRATTLPERAPIDELYSFRGAHDARYRRDPFLSEPLRRYAIPKLFNASLARQKRAFDLAERDCRAVFGFYPNDQGYLMSEKCLRSSRAADFRR